MFWKKQQKEEKYKDRVTRRVDLYEQQEEKSKNIQQKLNKEIVKNQESGVENLIDMEIQRQKKQDAEDRRREALIKKQQLLQEKIQLF